MDIDNKIKMLEDEINLIKGKYLNKLNFDINKKEDDLKNIINERDNIFKEMNDKILKEFKEINKIMEKNIINAINNKYEELKVMINNNDDNLNKKELNNLMVIKKVVMSNDNINKNIENDLNNKINENIINMINKTNLKNSELLDYIENNTYKLYDSLNFRSSYILNGIDLETVDDNFFEKWNKINIFKLFSSNDYEFKKALINKINDMKDFGKLLKLFNYKDDKIFNVNTITLLNKKFKNIIKTYKIETCPNFIKDVSLFIYMVDQKKDKMRKFLENTIEKNIKSVQTLSDIYINIVFNYKDISNDFVDYITDYFTKIKNKLNCEKILFLFQQLDSENIIKSLLNKMNNYVIEIREILSEKKEIDSIKLLEGIQKTKILEKYPELNKTKYFINTIDINQEFLNLIKEGLINYRSLYPIWFEKEEKSLFRERLNILFFNNLEDVECIMNIIDDKLQIISKELEYIRKLLEVLKEFYENSHQNNIKILENLEKKIKEGEIYLIEDDSIKNEIDEIHQILPDLDIKYKLKTSIIFVELFHNKKAYSLKTEDDIFNETLEDFNKLKTLFEEDWINKLDIPIIKQCYKALDINQDNNIKSQLKFLRDYFELKNIDDLYLDKLEDELKLFSKKVEIFQTVKSCLDFISALGAKPTDFSSSLEKIRKDISQNISLDKKTEYGKILVKYGINILEQKPEDKDYLNILSSLYSKKDSIKLLLLLIDINCDTLQELISKFLTEREIDILLKCLNFIYSFGFIKDNKTDQELISILIEKVTQEKNILSFFIEYTKNFEKIQEFLSKILDINF